MCTKASEPSLTPKNPRLILKDASAIVIQVFFKGKELKAEILFLNFQPYLRGIQARFRMWYYQVSLKESYFVSCGQLLLFMMHEQKNSYSSTWHQQNILVRKCSMCSLGMLSGEAAPRPFDTVTKVTKFLPNHILHKSQLLCITFPVMKALKHSEICLANGIWSEIMKSTFLWSFSNRP